MAICKSSSSSWNILLFFSFLACFPMLLNASSDKPRELVLLNWADYMDPELLRAFEQKYNAKVLTPYYESDDHRTEMLVQSKGKNYDLVIVDSPSIYTYAKAGWLARLETEQIPNLKNIGPRWRDSNDLKSRYSVPFLWGTLGIAYREDLVKKIPSKWMDLFRPDESLQGKIAMYRNTLDMIGASLKALGHSLNSTDPRHLEQAKQLILQQLPYVRSYNYLSLSEKSALITGEVVASMFYNSDALLLQEFNEHIKFVLPEEGGALWVDHLVVLENSDNKDLAWKFINFFNLPKNAAKLAEHVYSATPNTAAEALLSDEFLQDTVVYPDAKILQKSEMNLPLPADIIRRRNDIITLLPVK